MIAPVRVLLALLLLFAPVVAAEAGARSLIEAGRLPIAPSSDEFLDVGLANLIRLGKPDVLIIGTSAVRNGIRPDVLEELIEAETGEPVRVQGIAQSAMSLRAQLLLVQGLAGLDLLPDVMITGLTPVSLNGDNRDGDWFIRSELGQLWSGCADISDPEVALECWPGQGSAVWRWRGRPERLAAAAGQGMPTTISRNGRTLREDGWTSARPAGPRALRENLGWTLDRLPDHVSVPPFVSLDFARLISELEGHGVEVVTVTMPYAKQLEAALEARNPRWREQRREGFEQLEQAAGTDIISIEGFGDWARASSFYDLRHLSREGAGPFTRQLWMTPAFRAALLDGLASAP